MSGIIPVVSKTGAAETSVLWPPLAERLAYHIAAFQLDDITELISVHGYRAYDCDQREDLAALEAIGIIAYPRSRNWVIASPFALAERVGIQLIGKDNCFIFGGMYKGCQLSSFLFMDCSGSLVWIGDQTVHPSTINIAMFGDNAFIRWGDGSTSNGTSIRLYGEGRKITIGRDCMFAKDTEVMNADGHAIVDEQTGQWINPPVNMQVADHVWLGTRAMLLKTREVEEGGIVGAMACAINNVPARTVVAGVPARVLRTGCSWMREAAPPCGP